MYAFKMPIFVTMQSYSILCASDKLINYNIPTTQNKYQVFFINQRTRQSEIVKKRYRVAGVLNSLHLCQQAHSNHQHLTILSS